MTFSAKDWLRVSCAGLLAVLLWQAITQPLLYVTQLYIFSDEISLVGIIKGLWNSEERPLASLIFAIGIAAPFGKCLMLAISRLPAAKFETHLFGVLNIFSSLDAFIVALTIFYVKMSGLSSAQTRAGVLWLIGFIILSKLAEFAFVGRSHTQERGHP